MFQWILPAKAAPPLAESEHKSAFRKYRSRVLISTLLGYALYYIVKSNFTLASPYLIKELGFSKADIGLVLSALAISYGIGKFFMGVLADRLNPRYFISVGLILSAVFNIFFGQTRNLGLMVILMIGVGITQGIGAPCCQKSLAMWFNDKQLGTATSAWNTSHNIGSGTAALIVGGIVAVWGSANLGNIFLIPSVISIVMAIIVIILGVDTPQSVGLPKVKTKVQRETKSGRMISSLVNNVLKNPFVISLCLLNAFSYILRYGIVNWIPIYLSTEKGFSNVNTGFAYSVFEYAAIPGTIAIGLLSDRFFKGRRLPVTIMTSAIVLVCFPIYILTQSKPIILVMLAILGICVYAQQVFIGIIIMEALPVESVASGIGLSGFFGYAFGQVVASYGIGALVGKSDWGKGFLVVIVSGVICLGYFLYLNKKTNHQL